MGLEVTDAVPADAVELAEVAAATFPLACPPWASEDDVSAFIAANLSAAHFAGYLTDAGRTLLALREDGRIAGYAMLVQQDDELEVELSKFYVLPDRHGSGAAALLMRAVLDSAAGSGARAVKLGVNRRNERAQTFYRKHGFEITGTRTFDLGWSIEHDYVMTRPLSATSG
mgnify:CR=1 FL=1